MFGGYDDHSIRTWDVIKVKFNDLFSSFVGCITQLYTQSRVTITSSLTPFPPLSLYFHFSLPTSPGPPPSHSTSPQGNQITLWLNHLDRVSHLELSPDGTALGSCSWDGTLRVYTSSFVFAKIHVHVLYSAPANELIAVDIEDCSFKHLSILK